MAKASRATRRIFWIVGALLILVVILGVVGAATGLFGKRTTGVNVETETAAVRTITQVVTASGKIQPETEVKISPDVSGEIIELSVREGDQVSQGKLLARIRSDYYLAQAEQAEAGVLQAQSTLEQRRADLLRSESELRRQKDLFEKRAISGRDLEMAESEHEIAQAAFKGAQYAVRSAEARLREAAEQVQKTAIYAPMSGTISMLNVELGERVVGTSQMAGTEMMRIARLDHMEVEVDVNENEIVHVVLGDTASIEVDAYPDRRFSGIVTEIANSARVTGAGTQEQVTSFPVKVRILNDHNLESIAGSSGTDLLSQEELPLATADVPRFRPGMSGTVDIYTDKVFDVVAVPIQAVTVRDLSAIDSTSEIDEPAANGDADSSADGQPTIGGDEPGPLAAANEEDLRKVVFIVVDDTVSMVEVQTGISDDSYIEIKEGLTGGESVITGPYRAVSQTLKSGDGVRTRPAAESKGPVAVLF